MSMTEVRTIDDLPAEELRFHWKGGRLCLDLVATVGERWRRNFERLRAPADLARWIGETGLVAAPAHVGDHQLDDVRALREAVNRLTRPGLTATADDVGLVNRWAARQPLAPVLTGDGERTWHADRTVEAILATVAVDAIDLVTGPFAHRIRECGAPDCALLFVDVSRPGRRRWCSTDACGNRVRTRAYRARHRETS